MASLALLVAFIFMFVLLIGPISLIVFNIKFLPSWISTGMAIITLAVGVFWITLPIAGARLLGGIAIYFGWFILSKKYYNENK
jgi:hypothetical protein